MIADRLSQPRPDLALDLMWRFMKLADPRLSIASTTATDRSATFRTACEDLGVVS